MQPTSFDQREGFIWFDGQMIDWRDAKIHVLTHSLHYGSAAFEGERVYGGKVFKLTEHSARLHNSAKIMDYQIPFTVEQIDRATCEVIAANDIQEGYVRPIAWRGESMVNISAKGTKPHLAIAAWPWPAYYGDAARSRGIRLITSNWVRPSPNSAPTNSKTAGMYMICTLSRDAAEKAGFEDALMLDYRGRVAEATGANIFCVFDGILHTPARDCILDGITRRTVMDLARIRGIEVIERVIMPEELARAAEVFLTGTAIEVIPVCQIDRLTFSVGPITHSLMRDYHDLVRAS
jgi:branched-chain amino acid aminotransferase